MKRILVLPKTITGIVDVRQQDYYILEKVNYLEQISNALAKQNKNPQNYKFCQFEETETIPFWMNVKDKLTNGFSEFEAEKVKFKQLPISDDDKESLVKSRHLLPLTQELLQAKSDAMELMLQEWRGESIEELQKNQAIKKIDDAVKKIDKFDVQKHMNEIV